MVDWLWIPITVAAALFQCLRVAVQKYLKGRLSTTGATFTRFAFGAPAAIVYILVLLYGLGLERPTPNAAFAAWLLAASVAQILATFLLIYVLAFRNFPVGVAYSKTEVVQAAVFGLAFLGDPLNTWSATSIVVGTFGVMLMSLVASEHPLRAIFVGWFEKPALLGILSGALFAVAATGFRGASLSLEHPNPIVAASFTLAFATVLQSALMSVYIAWREREQFRAMIEAWRPSLFAGMTSVIGSACWFTAMTLQAVAYVRTVGLVELLFTFLVSALWFREKVRAVEVAGVALIAVGIAMILNPH
jgi:drug/metabolite transporter (DMT)-like permease